MKKVIYLIVICLIIKTSFAEDFWKQIDKPIYGEFTSMCSLSNGDLFSTSQLFPFGGGIYKSADNGRSWEKIEIGAYGQVCSDKNDNLYVIKNYDGHLTQKSENFVPDQEILKSTDGGKIWSKIDVPWSDTVYFEVLNVSKNGDIGVHGYEYNEANAFVGLKYADSEEWASIDINYHYQSSIQFYWGDKNTYFVLSRRTIFITKDRGQTFEQDGYRVMWGPLRTIYDRNDTVFVISDMRTFYQSESDDDWISTSTNRLEVPITAFMYRNDDFQIVYPIASKDSIRFVKTTNDGMSWETESQLYIGEAISEFYDQFISYDNLGNYFILRDFQSMPTNHMNGILVRPAYEGYNVFAADGVTDYYSNNIKSKGDWLLCYPYFWKYNYKTTESDSLVWGYTKGCVPSDENINKMLLIADVKSGLNYKLIRYEDGTVVEDYDNFSKPESIFETDEGEIFLINNDSLYQTKDFGGSWAYISELNGKVYSGDNKGSIFMKTTDLKLYKSTDGCKTFEQVGDFSATLNQNERISNMAFHPNGSEGLAFLSYGSAVLKTDDGGDSWTADTENISATCGDFDSRGNLFYYNIYNQTGGVYYLSDNSQTPLLIRTGIDKYTSFPILDIHVTDDNYVVLGTLGAGLFISSSNIVNSIEGQDYTDDRVSIHPVPATDKLNISFKKNNLNLFNISILDLMGNEIFHTASNSTNECTIDIGDFSPGLYLVKIETKKEILTRTIIIAR